MFFLSAYPLFRQLLNHDCISILAVCHIGKIRRRIGTQDQLEYHQGLHEGYVEWLCNFHSFPIQNRFCQLSLNRLLGSSFYLNNIILSFLFLILINILVQ